MTASTEELKTFRVFLRLLSVAQFALAVMAGAGLRLIDMLYDDTAARAAHPNRVAELQAMANYRPAYIALAIVSGLALAGGLASGICLWHRRARAFSMAVAILSLLLFPIGTVIGIATLITLGQKPIRDLYTA